MRTNLKVARGIFAAFVVGALGFGADQALASPAEGAAGYCTREEAGMCNWTCKETYGSGWAGRCTKNTWGHVSCGCYQIIIPS